MTRTASSYDFKFQPSTLDPEAYRFSFYMAKFGVTKAQAKRIVQRAKEERIFLSDAYQVNVTALLSPPPFGTGSWLSLKRRDKAPIEDRRVLGHAMRALVPGNHGYEVFPAPDRLVDTSNQFHAWTFCGASVFAGGYAENWVEEGAGIQTADLVGVGQDYAQGMRVLRVWQAEHLEGGVEEGEAAGSRTVLEHDWRKLQDAKERVFPGCEGVLLHMPEAGHALEMQMLVLRDRRARWPFGFNERLVTGAERAAEIGARQREL